MKGFFISKAVLVLDAPFIVEGMPGRAVGAFTYRGQSIPVELIGVASPTLGFACPCCGKRRRLNPARHDARVDESGALTVRETVRCPDVVFCGWTTRISAGVARDIENLVDFGLATQKPPESRKGQPMLWRRRPRGERERMLQAY